MTENMRAFLVATAAFENARAALPRGRTCPDDIRSRFTAAGEALAAARSALCVMPPSNIADATIDGVVHRTTPCLDDDGMRGTLQEPASNPPRSPIENGYGSARANREFVMLTSAFMMPDGGDFDLALLAIALHELQFQQADQASDQAAFEYHHNRGECAAADTTRHAAMTDAQSRASAAWEALYAARQDLNLSPPSSDDALATAYFQWVQACLEYDRLEKALWERDFSDDSEDGVADAARRRTEALAAFVAAAA